MNSKTPKLINSLLIILAACTFSTRSEAATYDGVHQLVARRFPFMVGKVVFQPLVGTNEEAFELQTQGKRLVVKATSPSAAAVGLNHYLNHYCHISISRCGNNLPTHFRLVPIQGTVRRTTPFKYRYALNYCTYNYSYAFYRWPDFEWELDWMALNGVNLMLAPLGMEAVWTETLKTLGFGQKDIQRFIPGPAYTAWWLMGNLEGWGGPMSESLIALRLQQQRQMLQRMRQLGIQPVVQGFPGIVPTFFKARFPQACIIEQGKWGSFQRPAVLLPNGDGVFEKVAEAYYQSLTKLLGADFEFLGGDLFHEGGITTGVDVGSVAAQVQRQMLRFFPRAKWVLQGWNKNPSPQLLRALDKRHTLLVNLSGEIAASWESSDEFGGTPWLWGSVNHFGGKTDMGGQLPVIVTEPHRALALTVDSVMQGIGILPEGIGTNPVVYDLALKTAWHTTTPDVDSMLVQYLGYRYGEVHPDLLAAWRIMLKSVYGEFAIKGEGTFESVFCARPSLRVTSVSTWGPKQMQYQPADLYRALGLFLKAAAAPTLRNSETYQYDLVDLARQSLANYARTAYANVVQAYEQKNAEQLQQATRRFEHLIALQDSLLQTNRHFLLGNWLQQATQYAPNEADRQLCVLNAQTLISYWGPDDPATKVHDYANKEWAGMLSTYYLPRWQAFFRGLQATIGTGNPPTIDFFDMEKCWANTPQPINTKPQGDAVQMAQRVLQTIVPPYLNASLDVETRLNDLLPRMTLDEKLAQTRHIHAKHYNDNGRVNLQKLRTNHTGGLSFGCFEAFPYSSAQYLAAVSTIQRHAMDSTRLGIPLIPVLEGIHGAVQDGCTIFPQAIAQGATFNPPLIQRMAQHVGQEMRAIGARQVLAPDLDLARELRWGRVEETFGEDRLLVAQMGLAYATGIQQAGCIPTLKHFVAHGTPQGGLNLASVKGGRRELLDVFVRPFAHVISRTLPGSVMNCYSAYDNEAITSSPFFMRQLLRDSLHFRGYVYSDWGSIPMLRYFHHTAETEREAAKQAIEAGVDLEAGSDYYRTVKQLVTEGELNAALIDSAAANVLRTKLAAGLFEDARPDTLNWRKSIHTAAAVATARQLADESLVLLENPNALLPLNAQSLKHIAVVGPNANQVQFGDYSWTADNRHGITPLAGIRQYLQGKGVQVDYVRGCDYYSPNADSIPHALRLAAQADLTIVVVGTQSMLLARASQPSTSGEGYDLSELTLPGVQQQLVDSLVALGKPLVVVLVTGRPLITESFRHRVGALVVQWYGGEQAGLSLARMLFGEFSPSGRLPVSFPKSVGQLPVYYNALPTDKGYYNKKGTPEKPGRDYVFSDPYPAYAFGHGLSYTSFDYNTLQLSSRTANEKDTIEIQFTVRNMGKRPAMEVAQLYVRDLKSSVATPVKQLYAFQKAAIAARQSHRFTLRLPIAELFLHDRDMRRVVEPGQFELLVGASSADIRLRDTLTAVPIAQQKSANSAPTRLKTSPQRSPQATPNTNKTIRIAGIVRNVQAFPLVGVKVTADGKTAQTNARGEYSLSVHIGSTLHFTLAGYRTETLVMKENGLFDVELTPETP